MITTVCTTTLGAVSLTSRAVLKRRYKNPAPIGWTMLHWVLLLGFATCALFIPSTPVQITCGVCCVGMMYVNYLYTDNARLWFGPRDWLPVRATGPRPSQTGTVLVTTVPTGTPSENSEDEPN